MSGAFPSPEMRCRVCGHLVAAARLGTRCPNDGAVLVLSRDLDARPDDQLLGRVIGGKFPIVGMLGEGGFGAVYRAVQEPVGRQVALKVIRGGDAADPEIRARFFREAKVVASLSHPAVVTLHDYGEEPDGLLYIAFELVAGRPLSEIVRSGGPMQPARAVSLVTQILSALTEAHNLGLLHRDLKPDNLMVTQGSLGEEKVRLLDFGLSKRFAAAENGDSVATRQGIIMGTPRYMSPEQASGQSVDGRSDLYAMGVLLYELLSGRPPFVHTSPLDLLMAHIGEPVPPLSASLNLPPALTQVVMKSLGKRPDQRFQTAADFSRELRAAVGEPSGGFASPLVSQSAPAMAAVTASSAGLKSARPDEETVEHQAVTDPVPAVAPPAVAPATTAPTGDFGTAAPEIAQRSLSANAVGHRPEPSAVTKPPRAMLPVLLAAAAIGVAGAVGLWLALGGSKPEVPPAALEPERRSVVVGGPPTQPAEPSLAAEPATAPPPAVGAGHRVRQGRT